MTLVVIGVFDGVHKGHQQILNRAKELAGGEKIIALTFDPHPTTVFAPERAPSLLTTLADRVELLKIHNADQVAVIKFTKEFAAVSPQDFVKNVLVDQLEVTKVVVGKDFTYGYKATGNIETLTQSGKELDFEVIALELVDEGDHKISSTRIRTYLVEGKVEVARELLSRPHRLDGVVVHGEKRGREIDIPLQT